LLDLLELRLALRLEEYYLTSLRVLGRASGQAMDSQGSHPRQHPWAGRANVRGQGEARHRVWQATPRQAAYAVPRCASAEMWAKSSSAICPAQDPPA